MNERMVQYEFKVIVQASEDAWPQEIRDEISNVISTHSFLPILKVVSVERISDY